MSRRQFAERSGMLPPESPEYHVHSHPSRVEHWRHLIEIVALVVAAAWGFYVFVYQEDIKPALEQPNVDFTVNVEHTALGNGEELIAVTPSWKNLGSEPVQIDGFLLNVSGTSYAGHDIGPWRDELHSLHVRVTASHMYSRGMFGVSTPLFAAFEAWRPIGGGLTGGVNAGDTLSLTRTFVIPQGRFNAVRVTDSWCDRREKDLRAFSFQPVRRADGTYDVSSLVRDERRHFEVGCEENQSGIERGI